MPDAVLDVSAPPAAPAAPPSAPSLPVRPITTVHNHEDQVTNRIAEAFQRHAQPAAPAPAPEPKLPDAVSPQVPPAIPAPSAPASPPELEPLSLDDIDFDAPDQEPAKPSPTTSTATPVPASGEGGERLSDQQLAASLATMLSKGEIPAQIEDVFLKTSRGKQMLESYKTLRELRKSPDEGGIGRIPTLDEIREGYSAAQELEAIRFEAVNNPQSFIRNLVSVQNGQNGLGADVTATQRLIGQIYPELVQNLAASRGTPMAQVNAELLAAYSGPVFSNFLDHQYRLAMAMPQASDVEKSDKARVLDALQIVEMKILGRPRPLNLNQPANGAPQPPVPDPEKEQMRARLQEYDQFYQNSQRQNYDNVQNSVVRNAEESAIKDIDSVFKQRGISAAYDASMLAPHRDELYNLVARALPQADPRGWQTYELQVQRAAMGQLDPAEAAKTYRILFQNGLRNLPQVRERLEVLLRHAKADSDQQHAQLQATQNRVAVQGQGAPAPQSVLPAAQTARQPGQSREEYFKSRIEDKLSAAVSQMQGRR